MSADVRGTGLVGVSGRVALGIAVALLALPARAVDAPHDVATLTNGCQDCHIPHAAGATLQKPGRDCVTCHASRGFTTWTTGDQATVGGATGSSHSWTGAYTNTLAGAGLPTNPAVKDRLLSANALSCAACHDPHSQALAPADPSAPTGAGYPGRHLMRADNSTGGLCADCHSAWAQSTADARQYTGTARSHPVRWQDATKSTTPLTLTVAGSGASDASYRKPPAEPSIPAVIQAGSTASVLNLDATVFKFATDALAGWTARITSGPHRNVAVRISACGATSVTLAAALGAAPAAGTTVELERAASHGAYDTTSNVGTTADQLQHPAGDRTWATSGAASPTGNTVTILSTTATTTAAQGQTCTIQSNTATALTLAAGCLGVTPAGGTWAYRVNWPARGAGTTTGTGSTTTFVDGTKTGWPEYGIVGMQVRFLTGNAVARVTAWVQATGTATFTPARLTGVAAGESYVLEPAQVGPYGGTVYGSTAFPNSVITNTTNAWTGVNLRGLLLRFTKSSAGLTGVVARITTNTSSSVTVAGLGATPAAGDTFEIDLDGNVTNNVVLGGAAPSYTAGVVSCSSCHAVHAADSSSGTYDRTPGGGDANLLRRAPGETCDGCHRTAIHSSVSTDSRYGTWGTSFTCATCHQPHQTNNVYLVRSQITTPNSGVKTVDFRNTTGAATNSFAAPTTQAPTTEICTVCHTQTARARNNVAYDWSQHFGGPRCTTCHTHQGGFGGSESRGATDCGDCHDFGMRVSDPARNGTYHHVMEAGIGPLDGSGRTSYPTNATPLTNAIVDKACIQCHVDHNLFRPDMNTSLGANGRANNLRTRIGSAPPSAAKGVGAVAAPDDTSTYFGNFDYANAGVGGVCISCHTSSQTRDVANQKNAGDGSTAVASLALASFSGSAHAYNVTGTITNGPASFTVACTKCHNSDPATAGYQSGANGARFALHASADRRLRAPLGQATLQDDRSEAFCYRCHSSAVTTPAIGGTVKAANANDWYGAVTTMTAASTDIYAQMQKGTAGVAAGAVSVPATTLNFKPSGEDTPAVAPAATVVAAPTGATSALYLKSNADDKYMGAQTLPTAYRLASGTYTGTAGQTTTNYNRRALSPDAGTAEDGRSQVTAATAGYFYRIGQFVSVPFAQTVTWNSGSTFTLTLGTRQSARTQNAFPQFGLWKYSPSSNTWTQLTCTANQAMTGATCTTTGTAARATIEAGDALTDNVRNNTHTFSFTTNAAVSFAEGDLLVAELEFIQSAAVAGTVQAYWGNGTTNARLQLPSAVQFQPDVVAGGGFAVRAMSTTAPATANETFGSAVSVGQGASAYAGAPPNGYGNPTTQYWSRLAFVSPPVATGGTTINAGTWTLNLFAAAPVATTGRVRYMIYKMDATGANVGTIVPRTQDTTAIPATAGAVNVSIASVPAVTLAANERIVIDLQVATVGVTANTAAASLQYVFGSTSVAKLVLPSAGSFSVTSTGTPASGRHDVAQYSGAHRPNPAEETRGHLASNKHVECEDCHNPHAARAGRHTKGAAGLAPVLTNATGVGVTTWGANWAGPTAYDPATTTEPLVTATAEWQICFKCHSGANANVTSWGGTGAAAFTDLALEFNPNNQSYHPVVQALPSTGNRRLAAGALTGGWTPGQVMACSDCHGSDSAASTGPHGSGVKWMLNPNTTGTKYYNWPYTTQAGNGGSTGTLLTGTGTSTTPTANFCFSCHVWSGGGQVHTGRSDHAVACVGCHIRVPHGGKALRLLTGPNAPARYKPNGAGSGTTYLNGGSRPSSGTMGQSDCQTSGGCNQHSAGGTLLGW